MSKLYTYKIASFPFSLILRVFKYVMKAEIVAMINPFTMRVVTLPNMTLPLTMLRHEYRHLAQVRKEGKLKFIVKYLYCNIKYGYWNNPYEVDARSVESKNIVVGEIC